MTVVRGLLAPLRAWSAAFIAVTLRELTAHAAGAATAVVLTAYAVASVALTLQVGGWLDRGSADLLPFFRIQPWILALVAPAVAMRMWAEERRSGTDELLLSLPVPTAAAVLGKLAAGWAVLALGLALTLPLWLTAAWLGAPDHGVIAAGYGGLLLLAALYLAIGGFASALSASPVIAYVIGAALGLGLTGLPWAPAALADPLPAGAAAATVDVLAWFDDWARGAVDLRAVVLFVSLATLFAGLTVLCVRPVPRVGLHRLGPPAAGCAAVLLTAAINLLAGGWTAARLDVTADDRHSLAPATRAVLASLDEPVRLDFYRSDAAGRDARASAAIIRRVRELLDAYAAAAPDRLIVREVPAPPFSEAEDAAVAQGLIAVAEEGGEPMLLGLVATNSVDTQRVVPFLAPDLAGALEHAVTQMLRDLAWPDGPRIGVLSTLPLAGDDAAGDAPWAIWQVLDRAYVPVRLDIRDLRAVPPDLDALIVVHPHDLPDRVWAAVDQALMSGLPTVLFVDPHSEAQALRRPDAQLFAPAASGFGPLGPALGLGLRDRAVVGDPDAAVVVDVGRDGRIDRAPYLPWLDLGADTLGGAARVRAQVDLVSLATAGFLEVDPTATATATPLLTAGPRAGPIAVGRVAVAPRPRALLDDHRPQDDPAVLALHLTGRADSAFPAGPPDAAAAPAGWHTGTEALDLVVIADTDLLDDRLWTQADETGLRPIADNALWLANLLDTRLGLVDLTDLRARTVTDRTFTRLDAMRAAAEADYRDTEQTLRAELAAAERAWRDALAEAADDPRALSDRLYATRGELRQRLLQIRGELRAVRRALGRDLEALELRIVAINLLVPPILVVVLVAASLAGRHWRHGAGILRARWG